jgi:hypothetical protein
MMPPVNCCPGTVSGEKACTAVVLVVVTGGGVVVFVVVGGTVIGGVVGVGEV